MKLLPVGDGSTYIDLGAAQHFKLRGVTYYRAQNGAWVRSDGKGRPGQAITECDAFKAFINADMPTEAEKYFPELFREGVNVKAAIEPDSKSANAAHRRPWRFVFGGIAVLLVAAYAVAIIMGKIPASRQISLSGVALFVIAAMLVIGLFRPQWFREIQGLQFGSFRVDMRERLDKIQATQEDQNKNLNEIHFILESLVTQTQMKHLRGLDRGFTGNYRRSPQLLAELRYLRDVGLIESIEDKFHFADLPATKFDLSHYVRLTQRGREYLRRVSMAVPPSDASAPQNRTNGQ